MKCADPVLCWKKPSGQMLFRHFSLASPIFKLAHNLVFNCGKCIYCRKKKSIELATRCVLHASLYKHNCFLTLTYDEKKQGYHNDFYYKDIQDFKKRYRQYVWRKFQKRISIFNVHEYGRNGKKHWHLIVFNHDFSEDRKKSPSNYYNSQTLLELWPHGHHSIGDVTEASAMYQAQYTQKDFKYGNVSNTKKSHSRHSGIGRDYFLKHYEQILRLGYIPFGGKKMPIPRYFQKLAHKHYSHFYEKSNFFDTPNRKALYRPFKNNEQNKHIADLYKEFHILRQEHIEQLKQEWEEHIEKYIFTDEKPDFIISAENHLYDLQKKLNTTIF